MSHPINETQLGFDLSATANWILYTCHIILLISILRIMDMEAAAVIAKIAKKCGYLECRVNGLKAQARRLAAENSHLHRQLRRASAGLTPNAHGTQFMTAATAGAAIQSPRLRRPTPDPTPSTSAATPGPSAAVTPQTNVSTMLECVCVCVCVYVL